MQSAVHEADNKQVRRFAQDDKLPAGRLSGAKGLLFDFQIPLES